MISSNTFQITGPSTEKRVALAAGKYKNFLNESQTYDAETTSSKARKFEHESKDFLELSCEGFAKYNYYSMFYATSFFMMPLSPKWWCN